MVRAQKRSHRVDKVELEGHAGPFGWMRRGRAIRVLDVVPQERVDLAGLKAQLHARITKSEFWSENEDVSTLLADLSAVDRFDELIDLFAE